MCVFVWLQVDLLGFLYLQSHYYGSVIVVVPPLPCISDQKVCFLALEIQISNCANIIVARFTLDWCSSKLQSNSRHYLI